MPKPVHCTLTSFKTVALPFWKKSSSSDRSKDMVNRSVGAVANTKVWWKETGETQDFDDSQVATEVE